MVSKKKNRLRGNIIVKFDHVEFNDQTYPCSIGRNGLINNKIEGDGCTPIGNFPIDAIYYRKDKIGNLETKFKKPIEIHINYGWCCELGNNYNKFMKFTDEEVAIAEANQLHDIDKNERLWRPKDNLYDVIIVIGYNTQIPENGKGSAIFIHIARENMSPTSGCIGLKKTDILELIKDIDNNTMIKIT